MSDPEPGGIFRENDPLALKMAKRLGCRQLNALVGVQLPNHTRPEQLQRARENVAWAADRAAALSAAREYGLALPLTAVVDQLFLVMKQKGWGGEDHSGLLRVIEELSNFHIA